MAGRFKFVAIAVVGFGLLLGVAFGLGVKYGKGKETTNTGGLTQQQVLSLIGATGGGGGAAAAGGAGGAGAAGGAGGAGGANNPLANLTAGRITAVQGQIITVETRTGPVKVNVGATASVNKTAQGAPQDLVTGATVSVSGAKGPDGSVNATAVSILPPDLATILGGTGGATNGGGTGSPQGASPQAPATRTTP